MKTTELISKKRYYPIGPGLLALLMLSLVVSSCSGGSRYKINLMPAPAVFEDGAINPLPRGLPPVSYDDFRILYATDRKPSDDPEKRPFYDQSG